MKAEESMTEAQRKRIRIFKVDESHLGFVRRRVGRRMKDGIVKEVWMRRRPATTRLIVNRWIDKGILTEIVLPTKVAIRKEEEPKPKVDTSAPITSLGQSIKSAAAKVVKHKTKPAAPKDEVKSNE